MYKNQLQELAQRSCFCLPSYICIREGPDHAPRFKATVNFNGEVFESPSFCTTLRQAEHAAAEVALNALSSRGPSHSLAARILDETGVYKNLLQEVAQRVGAPLPSYATVRCGHGHHMSFSCTVELAGILFTGEPAKSKKQAEKNAAMTAWNSLKQLARQESGSLSEPDNSDELEQIIVARALLGYRLKEKIATATNPNAPPPFPKKFLVQSDKKPLSPHLSSSGSKILPMIRPRLSPRTRPSLGANDEYCFQLRPTRPENQSLKFHAGVSPYIPLHHLRMPCAGVAPPVTIRTSVPVFSSPPLPPPSVYPHLPTVMNQSWRAAQPVRIRTAVPVFAAPPALFPQPQLQATQMQVKEPPAAGRLSGAQMQVEEQKQATTRVQVKEIDVLADVATADDNAAPVKPVAPPETGGVAASNDPPLRVVEDLRRLEL
ncbi:Double-stranded RNA-binding protein 6 [Platanthera zijinensis]|uniref:Double-stranded RNA-binding protein 6 n=1 Tax=Platanthera zijinensis TaxID=2320716 RepID=A0AAP0BQF1_9ASPA